MRSPERQSGERAVNSRNLKERRSRDKGSALKRVVEGKGRLFKPGPPFWSGENEQQSKRLKISAGL